MIGGLTSKVSAMAKRILNQSKNLAMKPIAEEDSHNS